MQFEETAMDSSRWSRLVIAISLGEFALTASAQPRPPAGNKPAAQQPPATAQAPQRPPELQALNRLAGIWNVEVTSNTIGETPEGKVETQKGKAVETMQWVLDDSFIAGHSTGETGRTLSAWMWGYDQNTKTLRLWWFGVAGQVTEWGGAYDASTQTITLRTQAAGGYQSTATIQFVDDNTRKQIVEVRNAEGKPTQRIVASMVRRK